MPKIDGTHSLPSLKEQHLEEENPRLSITIPRGVKFPTSFSLKNRQIVDETKGPKEEAQPTKQTLTRTQIFAIKAEPNNKDLVLKYKNQFRKNPSLNQIEISPSDAKKLGL
ncbi:MAG: hypothetical protein KDK50_03425 [Chlamydiia bacterium]|nr:hypothetical protein [Chlamydiia bacterium]